VSLRPQGRNFFATRPTSHNYGPNIRPSLSLAATAISWREPTVGADFTVIACDGDGLVDLKWRTA
jgi:hypothetical protein